MTQPQDEWLIIHTADGAHLWNLGQPTDDERETLTNAARVVVGFPAHDRWPFEGDGWTLALSFGEPHPSLVDRAEAHTRQSLARVPHRDVAAHAQARRSDADARSIKAAQEHLLSLDPDMLQRVLDHPDIQRGAARAKP